MSYKEFVFENYSLFYLEYPYYLQVVYKTTFTVMYVMINLQIMKVVSTKISAYIYDFILPVRQSQRHSNTNSFSCRTEYFKNSFILCVIGEWNKLNPEMR